MTNILKALAIGIGLATNIDAADTANRRRLAAPRALRRNALLARGRLRRLAGSSARCSPANRASAWRRRSTRWPRARAAVSRPADLRRASRRRPPTLARRTPPGRGHGLDARADGLYVRAAWNDLGEKNRARGLSRLSVARVALRPARRRGGSGIIAPDELRSVGLTNTPRLPDVPAWTNADDPLPPIHSTSTQPTMNYKALAARTLRPARRRHRRTPSSTRPRHAARSNSAPTIRADANRRATRRAGSARRRSTRSSTRRSTPGGSARRNARDSSSVSSAISTRRCANSASGGSRSTRTGWACVPTGLGLDLSTAHGRAAAFNARIDALMRPVAAGGTRAAFRRRHRRDARQRRGRRAAARDGRQVSIH